MLISHRLLFAMIFVNFGIHIIKYSKFIGNGIFQKYLIILKNIPKNVIKIDRTCVLKFEIISQRIET